jgi:hypothetical protein
MVFLLGVCALAASSCGTTNESVFRDAGLIHDSGIPFFDGTLNDAELSQQNPCAPRTCADWGYDCGPAGDGCGGLITSCGTCTAPDFCGGGGRSVCGTQPPTADGGADAGDAGSTCVPQTCEELGFDCGIAVDRCQNVLLCGTGPDGGAATLATGVDAGTVAPNTCPAPEFCGGGGPNKCGGNVTTLPDGGTNSQCVPKPCPSGANCGVTGDGCGNAITCGGSCTSPAFCGANNQPNVCGGNNGMLPDGGSTCVPQTCASLGYNCGPTGDGCGGVLQCGSSCPAPQFCGGGGPNKCGGNVNVAPDGAPVDLCTPTTCAAQHVSCGQVGDGCGNLLNCGNCTLPDTCGGAGVPGACGHVCVGAGGLCSFQTCTAGTPTTITGKVFAGRSAFLNPSANTTQFTPDPVPNVLVYVPNDPVLPFSAGTACRQCGADVSGSPLVSAYTNFDGSFTLSGVPVPPSTTLPLVIQLGRWRRQFTITTPPACTTSLVAPVGGTAGVLNLPRNHTEGDIPLTAISTGNVDALECVLLKMGVDAAEFTSSAPRNGAAGRIHVYAGTTGDHGSEAGATVPNAQPETSLMGNNGSFMSYDQILFPCWGGPATKTAAELANLVSYADNGGHFFTTHYSYSWLVGNGEFNGVANWDLPNGAADADNPGNVNWTLNVSLAPPVVSAPLHPGIFYQWLNYVCALSNASGTCNPFNANPAPTNPQVSIFAPRFDADSVAGGSVDWIDGTDQNMASNANGKPLVEHFTFNTPVGSQNQCGHAIYSDFHVANINTAFNVQFPNECSTTFTPQEKILEYMLFDLASCVAPPPPVTCQPVSCAAQGLSCGPTGDGCGHTIQCGVCTPPLTCGGGGVRGVCGEPDGGACTPLGCGNRCGPQGDGCGGTVNCPCPTGTTCGGAGVPNQCGTPGSCTPRTCAQQSIECGPAGDGCGNLIAGGCGACPTGTVCGAGGVPGVCAPPDGGACVPQTCGQQGIACGPAGDGCGDLIANCGVCTPPQTCGGGGVPGQCGNVTCQPATCASLGADCGPVGDGCGGLLACGDCPPGQFCGANGRPNVCGMNIPK